MRDLFRRSLTAAATSPFGILSLVIVILGLISFFFFRIRAAELARSAYSFSCLLVSGLFVIATFRVRFPYGGAERAGVRSAQQGLWTSRGGLSALLRPWRHLESNLGRNDQAREDHTPRRARSTSRSRTAWVKPTHSWAWAIWRTSLCRNDQAREAFADGAARSYKQEQNRLGEANVLLGLQRPGDANLGRNDQARETYAESNARSTSRSRTSWVRPTCSWAWASWKEALQAATTKLKRTSTKPPMCMKRLVWKNLKNSR